MMISLDKNVLEIGYKWGIKKLNNGHWRPAWLLHSDVEGQWDTHAEALAVCNERNKRWFKR